MLLRPLSVDQLEISGRFGGREKLGFWFEKVSLVKITEDASSSSPCFCSDEEEEDRDRRKRRTHLKAGCFKILG